ncbi:hypothetical protein P5W99_35825 [Paraburkholderia sp. A3BS-1L]|uniref:hypothetical protein n=1 Tax=Paraburkholderia sp. A3BS-1L TaxID=3028375 RepID=UPI003DA9CC96
MDIRMPSETGLREQYANLQQRSLLLDALGPSRAGHLSAAMQSSPAGDEASAVHLRVLKEATGEAMPAVKDDHGARPFVETAHSLPESRARPPAFADDTEQWHSEILARLQEVLDRAAEMIAEGEAHLERSRRVQLQDIPWMNSQRHCLNWLSGT